MTDSWASRFRGSRVLITGGMGFLGSNLAITLVSLGADVTIADAMIEGYGGNLFNIEPIRKQVTVNYCDIRDVNAMNYLVVGHDYVFHLAGQVDHILSLTDPFPDLDINIKGTVIVMEACRRFNPRARVVYTGTRGQYGAAVSLPVAEDAPTHPKGIYEISNLTAEKIISIYNEIHDVHSVSLRITNVYGPRAQMRHSRYGVANWFVRLILDRKPITVFGDGRIKRDFLYVDDCTEALLMCAAVDEARGQILNVGVDQPTDFVELAESMVKAAGEGEWQFAPFTPERLAQEPGDFFSDITRIKRLVGWEPRTRLADGLRATFDFYRAHRIHYWS